MRYISAIIVALLLSSTASVAELFGQDQGSLYAPIANPEVGVEGAAPLRTEFISYEVRRVAEDRDLDQTNYYLPLNGEWRVNYVDSYSSSDVSFAKRQFNAASWDRVNVPSNVSTYAPFSQVGSSLVPPALPNNIPAVQYRAEIMVPLLWLDREMFVHVEGVGSAYTLYINGERVGYSNDDKSATEYNISKFMTDGSNSICFEVYGYSTGDYLSSNAPSPGSLKDVYVYSQPSLRIADYVVRTKGDSLWRNGIINLDIIIANGYGREEAIKIGYDLYGPDGKLRTYNLTDDIVLAANSTDTLCFSETILHAMTDYTWSPENPNLYDVMLYVRQGQRIIEYIPFRIGFNEAEFVGERFIHNRKEVELQAVTYNAEGDAATTEATLRKIKAYGKNAICPEYPQPLFFYELCDKVGLFVIDQANINSWYRVDDRNMGGAVVNDPRWLTAMQGRIRTMYERTKNHTSVIARSMGGYSGNGYNLYKSYLDLKSIDSLDRITVTYRDLQGEWNSDITFPETISAAKLFETTMPTSRR